MPDASKLDEIISNCDFEPDDINTASVSSPPFSVFRSSDVVLRRNADFRLLPNPKGESRIYDKDSYIFYHFVQDVAPGLMPSHDRRNPWSAYPSIALHHRSNGKKHLFNSLMAHAAISLANKGYDEARMIAASAKYYVLAVQELRLLIGGLSTDYVGSLTTILTLLITEVRSPRGLTCFTSANTALKLYHGRPKTWRPHLNGGWQFLLQHEGQGWELSEQAWYATQSFCLIKIIGDTTSFCPPVAPLASSCHTEAYIMDAIISDERFGLTSGASNSLMRCLADINILSLQLDSSFDVLSTARAALDVLRRLKLCRDSDQLVILTDDNGEVIQREQAMAQYHLRAFVAAAHIFFYQVFYNVGPCSVAEYVSEVLDNLTMFIAIGGVNFTIWPAFIAAVEVFQIEDKTTVEQMFAGSHATSSQHRCNIRAVVKEVWRVREERAAESGLEVRIVTVDWRDVMRDLDLDLMLL